MRDWPGLSLRTKVFTVVVVGLTAAQYALTLVGPQQGLPLPLASAIGQTVLLMCLALLLWVVANVHGEGAPPRWAIALVVIGASLRSLALAPLTYDVQDPPLFMPSTAHLYVLAAGYVMFIGGYLAIVVRYRRGIDPRHPMMWSLAGSTIVGLAFAFAAFGPLPGIATVMTPRDHLAAALLVGDIVLLIETTYITFASLQHVGGVLARAWLWLAVSILIIAMADTGWPLLTIYDAARYTAPFWGLGYALSAIGASMLLDILDSREERPALLGGPWDRASAASNG